MEIELSEISVIVFTSNRSQVSGNLHESIYMYEGTSISWHTTSWKGRFGRKESVMLFLGSDALESAYVYAYLIHRQYIQGRKQKQRTQLLAVAMVVVCRRKRKSITVREVRSSWRFYNNKFELKLDLSLLQERKIITYNLLQEQRRRIQHTHTHTHTHSELVTWHREVVGDVERYSLHH